ncbi:MAG: hypothetical protein AAFY88_29390, partial [Acidobacteriota bacterium]
MSFLYALRRAATVAGIVAAIAAAAFGVAAPTAEPASKNDLMSATGIGDSSRAWAVGAATPKAAAAMAATMPATVAARRRAYRKDMVEF